MRRALALLMLSLCACTAARPVSATDERAEKLRAAVRADPGSQRADDAQEDLVALEYQRAIGLHTVLGYKRFLEANPRSPQADDVRARLETLRWNSARERATSSALNQFLQEHPNGAHAAEAKALLAKAQLRELGSTDTEQLRKLARAEDGTDTGAQAAERLDDAAYGSATAKGALGLFEYLRDFPAGSHRLDAQAALLSLRLQALLFSGERVAAREEAAKNPELAKRISDLEARFDRAEAEAVALAARSQAVRAALPENYLRPVEDLRRALGAPDPLDRWQAAEELGQQVSVAAIDPLLDAIRGARNALIRQRAFESLILVLGALPAAISDYEVARRLEALATSGETTETLLLRAVLHDASGKAALAEPLYGKAFDASTPDPLILRRWIAWRHERKQVFSSAVAARQLAVWTLDTSRTNDPSAPDFAPLWASRALCGAAEYARVAEDAITRAASEVSEFPEDLEAFRLTAHDARRLAEARLSDAENALRRIDPNALGCADRRVTDRLEEAAKLRASALDRLRAQVPTLAPTLLKLASERDPSPAVRARAVALLSSKPRG